MVTSTTFKEPDVEKFSVNHPNCTIS